jgi:Uncharacterized protein containing a von Willebrand factor type A (vWA) domain
MVEHVDQSLPAGGRSTVVELVIDETGSMSAFKAATISAINSFLKDQAEVEGECLLSLSKFHSGSIRTPIQDIDIRFVPPMTERTFLPGGGTNLYDAIIERINALSSRTANWTGDFQVLFVVLTDGEDNMSRNGPRQVRALIKKYEAANWRFMYLGATDNALTIAKSLGFHRSRSKKFKMKDIERTMAVLSASTTVYRATGVAEIA